MAVLIVLKLLPQLFQWSGVTYLSSLFFFFLWNVFSPAATKGMSDKDTNLVCFLKLFQRLALYKV